jgi:regulator of protease activity HflC (stomatin/prohibitin superfamily)
MIIGLAILAFAIIVALGYRRFQLPKGGGYDRMGFLRYAVSRGVIVAAVAIVLGLFQGMVVVVPAGSRAVVFDVLRGGVKPVALGEGLNFIMPFTQEATLMDVRVQKGEYDAEAASKDLQTVHAKVAVNFHPEPASVPQLFREVGINYTEKVIHPAVQEALKASSAKYTAEELITKREEVKQAIHDHLSKVLAKSNINLIETYITNFEFSTEFSTAIEAKQVAEQEALKARRDLDRIKIEAEQQVATARAQAEALRMQREAVTSQLIELRRVEMQKAAIEKWDGHMPQTMFGNTMPFVDVSHLTSK